jgi:transcriptional regulator with XRE-family HTH domain
MGKDIAARLGRNIAAARKAAGKTQAEIAEKVGIETVSLSRIERGVVTPAITTLDRIADTLGVPLGRLFDGVSSRTATMADDIATLLEPLSEEDRHFFLEQIQIWAKRLSK